MFPSSPLTIRQSAALGLAVGLVVVISWAVVFSAESDLLQISAIVVAGIVFIYSQLILLNGAKLGAMGWERKDVHDESLMKRWGVFFFSAMLVGSAAIGATLMGFGT